jgi:ketosteroid isomerase-like protein
MIDEDAAADTSRTGAEEVVRAVYAAFTSADPEKIERAVRELFADDVVVHEPESLPWGGRYDGIETVAAMTVGLADPSAPVDAGNLTIDQVFVGEDSTSGPFHVVAAVSFPWRGHTTIAMRALEWFTVDHGKVTEIRVFLWDTAAAIAALQGPQES